jgi:vancomycin permeability regulator SanA
LTFKWNSQSKVVFCGLLTAVALIGWGYYQVSAILATWASSIASPPKVSVALVLGDITTGSSPGEHLRHRLDRALRLYQDGTVERLLVSGGGQPPEAEVAKEYLTQRGVPPERIWVETASCSTAENVHNSKRLLEARGVDEPVLVITNGAHLRRALHLANEAGLKGWGVAAESSMPHFHKEWLSIVREIAAQFLHSVWVSPPDC